VRVSLVLLTRDESRMDVFDVAPHGVRGGVYYIPAFVTEGEASVISSRLDGANAKRWTTLKGRRAMMVGGQPPRCESALMIPEPIPMWLRTGVLDKVESFVKARAAPGPGVSRVSGGGGLNHVLVNEYQPDGGIEAHEDGCVYDGFAVILSLEEMAVLDFEPSRAREETRETTGDGCTRNRPFSLVLEPNSLVIFCGPFYDKYTHGIAGGSCLQTGIDSAANADRIRIARTQTTNEVSKVPPRFIERTKRRLSLTLRRVKPEYVSKIGSKIVSQLIRQ